MCSIKIRTLVSLILLLFGANLLSAQKKVIHQNLLWYSYTNQLVFNEKWYLSTEFQERTFISPYAQHQFLIRTHLHRIFMKQWDASIGFCYFLQDNNDPYSNDKLSIPELRPHIEILQKQKFKYFTLENRLRAEFRFFHNLTDSKKDLERGFSFGNFRFRYQISSSIPLVKLTTNQFLKLKIAYELHINAGKNITKNIFDQHRIYAALSIDILPSLSFDAGYLNWYQQRPSGTEFYNRNIIRFVVNQKIVLKKKNNGTSKI